MDTTEIMIPPLARKALDVGLAHFWAFQFVGRGEAPAKPVYQDGWWYETVTKAPQKAIKRLEALETAGIKVKAIIVAHEAPRLLGSPNPQPKPDFEFPSILPKIEKVKLVAGKVGGLIGVVAGASVAVIAVLIPVLGFVASLLFMPLILIDPAVIAVLEDGSRVKLTSWVV